MSGGVTPSHFRTCDFSHFRNFAIPGGKPMSDQIVTLAPPPISAQMERVMSAHDKHVRGLRRLTPKAVANRLAAGNFDGLPPGVTRDDLVRAIDEGGLWCGLSRPQVRRLVYLVRHTEEIDWQDGDAMPVVWVSVARMAFDLDVSRRQIAKVERQLAETGWVSHRDAPDRRRWGERDPVTGRIVKAFGVELGALGQRYGELAAAATARRRAAPP